MRKLWVMAIGLGISQCALAAPSIETFTKGMEEKDGFIDLYYDKKADKVYLEIEHFDSPFIFQTSLPQGMGSNDIGLDRGQLGDTRLVEFERYGNKVMLKQLNTEYRASSDNPAEQASIDEAFADSVLQGFTVVAETDDAVIIDYTDYLLSDVHGISGRLAATQQGNFKADKSRSGVFIDKTKAFPLNTEVESMVTFGGSNAGEYVRQVTPDPDSITVHLHHSFVALPDDGYEPRQFDPMSGYWSHSYQDYSAPITAPMRQQLINRHRLAKKDPTAAVSEAITPIIYYLDPGIPEPVMSALKDGASWWNQAFEAIGYKDAFQVKVLPEDADPMDVRYNVIQWVHRATRGWSYGSSVVDPRTGEIIKGHVTLGSLRVRQDYLIALGLTSPFSDDNADITPQKEMALARIRQLSAHEVGHTLGIAHNFAASEYGRESVMDYPHPRITMKDGEISLDGAYDTGMGEWDKHAIAYGYQDFVSAEAESEGLAHIVANARNKGMRFKSDADARSAVHGSADGHLWDNGTDPISAFNHISMIRRTALNNMGINTLQTGQGLSALEDAFVPVFLLHRYQLNALAKQVGGVNYEYETKGAYEEPKGQTFVSGTTQIEAINLMIEASTAPYLTIPDNVLSLITPKVYGDYASREHFKGRTGRVFDPASAAEAAAGYSLSLLLHPEKLNRLAWQHDHNSQVPSPAQLVHSILSQHFFKAKSKPSILAKRLQLVALNSVMKSLSNDTLAPEVKVSIEDVLLDFTEWLDDEDDIPGNRVLEKHFETYWETGAWPAFFDVAPMPPGSPI